MENNNFLDYESREHLVNQMFLYGQVINGIISSLFCEQEPMQELLGLSNEVRRAMDEGSRDGNTHERLQQILTKEAENRKRKLCDRLAKVCLFLSAICALGGFLSNDSRLKISSPSLILASVALFSLSRTRYGRSLRNCFEYGIDGIVTSLSQLLNGNERVNMNNEMNAPVLLANGLNNDEQVI